VTTKTWVVWSDGWEPREFEEGYPEFAAESWAHVPQSWTADGKVIHVHLKEGGNYHRYRVRQVISYEVEDEE